MKIDTKLVLAGEPSPRILGAVTLPTFQSATFQYRGAPGEVLRYGRYNNTPTHEVLQNKLAALENAEAAVVTASGMAAISTTVLALLKSGDHLLAQNCLYGGTLELFAVDLPALGIEVSFVDGNRPDSWRQALRPTTKAIYVEVMTNPLLEVADLQAVVAFARAHGLVAIIDNTFATPVNFRPLDFGFDLSLYSCTKYLNGHSDLVAGAVVGKRELVDAVTTRLKRLGTCLDPHACFLLYRGLKTLALRVRCQNQSALRIATFLAGHPLVRRVYYPGLATHPSHARAAELFDGFGGVLSFELTGGEQAAESFLERLRIAVVAPSLGGVETLVTRPVTTSHRGVPAVERQRLGISDGLIRVSVGIEDVEDLIADFSQAWEGAAT
ncbi:MAG: aminotransferase class I/II-fold pyridoxal phosphate-dependent enzyme [candidate division KSB1 bacterium]|jgi:cystathionine beta-lyase/cystathionine gamma-synthase|nr:aminotransferase class I/II-fold pyridoxal phosphate-dependent enzyme [candidate division KSB1 bacterium]